MCQRMQLTLTVDQKRDVLTVFMQAVALGWLVARSLHVEVGLPQLYHALSFLFRFCHRFCPRLIQKHE